MAEILTAAQRVVLARHIARPGTADFIAALFTDFFEQKGDRQNREDPSILGGIALYKGHPVTVIGHRKGKTLEENVAYNFGMPGPEGYRKAQRLMDQAEKFKRPVITFVDTPGAYPGLEAEARGQGEAIASTIARMSCFLDPIAARADVEGMGLKNTGGYIFYDGNNGNWLDPSKPAARQYLCTLAAELAQQGFDEILLTDVGYPTVGKLDKIDYNGADRAASIRLFLEELRSALGEYGVAVSIELPPEVITSGADDTAGLVLSDIAPLVDRVYAVTTVDQIPALEAAVSAAGEDTDFVAELTGHSPDVTGSCLILAD